MRLIKKQTIYKKLNPNSSSYDRNKNTTIYCHVFDSINEFINFIQTQPLTDAAFNTTSPAGYLESTKISVEKTVFTGTRDFDEAMNLLKHGWAEGAEQINTKLKENKYNTINEKITKQKSVYDVVGGNASVPRYLQGIPTNMVRQVRTPVKQKVKNIESNIAFSAGTLQSDIIDSCKEKLQDVVSTENSGTQVNLWFTHYCHEYTSDGIAYHVLRVCIKKSTERTNISKLAFPMTHPSMLRRIVFAFQERNDCVSEYFYTRNGYGYAERDKSVIDNINKTLCIA